MLLSSSLNDCAQSVSHQIYYVALLSFPGDKRLRCVSPWERSTAKSLSLPPPFFGPLSQHSIRSHARTVFGALFSRDSIARVSFPAGRIRVRARRKETLISERGILTLPWPPRMTMSLVYVSCEVALSLSRAAFWILAPGLSEGPTRAEGKLIQLGGIFNLPRSARARKLCRAN